MRGRSVEEYAGEERVEEYEGEERPGWRGEREGCGGV